MPASGSGNVIRFSVRKSFADRYPVRTVGGSVHQELWIPAEELPELNRSIAGLLEVIAKFTSGQKEKQG